MEGYIVAAGNYRMEEFGTVHVTVRRTARSIRARWKGARLEVSAPTGIAAAEVLSALRAFAPRMHAAKPPRMYSPGDRLEFPEVTVFIDSQDADAGRIFYEIDGRNWHIRVGEAWDFDSHDTMRAISDSICRMARREAPPILLPYAAAVADEIGVSPIVWTVSNGHRVLGHCSARREIALSYVLIFLPERLRRFIVCHELAHLSEMNHSPRFHALCDAYLGGCEAALRAELKAFRFPFIR